MVNGSLPARRIESVMLAPIDRIDRLPSLFRERNMRLLALCVVAAFLLVMIPPSGSAYAQATGGSGKTSQGAGGGGKAGKTGSTSKSH
jgi:hypothetical protein